jgi:hypothetical protein
LVNHFLSAQGDAVFVGLIPGGRTLVAVHAFEGPVVNAIPAAMADWLAGRFNADLDRSIVQINRVGHTGADGWHRLANQALFDGFVALTGKGRSATTSLPRQTLFALREKHGTLELWWVAQFGFGFEGLTKSEAEYLLRVESAERIRDRILAAGQGAGAG